MEYYLNTKYIVIEIKEEKKSLSIIQVLLNIDFEYDNSTTQMIVIWTKFS